MINLDGSYTEYIHNSNNKTLNYTIINNVKNAREGGDF